jgi:hypothetical protein
LAITASIPSLRDMRRFFASALRKPRSVSGPLASGLQHDLLAEVRHLFVGVLFVEGDEVFQRAQALHAGRAPPDTCSSRLELVEQHFKFRIIELAVRRDVGRIDNLAPARFITSMAPSSAYRRDR